jgi:hypothetical protein
MIFESISLISFFLNGFRVGYDKCFLQSSFVQGDLLGASRLDIKAKSKMDTTCCGLTFVLKILDLLRILNAERNL